MKKVIFKLNAKQLSRAEAIRQKLEEQRLAGDNGNLVPGEEITSTPPAYMLTLEGDKVTYLNNATLGVPDCVAWALCTISDMSPCPNNTQGDLSSMPIFPENFLVFPEIFLEKLDLKIVEYIPSTPLLRWYETYDTYLMHRATWNEAVDLLMSRAHTCPYGVLSHRFMKQCRLIEALLANGQIDPMVYMPEEIKEAQALIMTCNWQGNN